MDCKLFRELIFDYLGGGLDAESLDGFRRHFGACPACAGALKSIEAQETILASAPHPKAPPALWTRITDALGDRELLRRLDRPGMTWLRRLAAAAAVLVLAVAGALLMRGGAPADGPGITFEVRDVTGEPGADVLGQLMPGFENPEPMAFDFNP